MTVSVITKEVAEVVPSRSSASQPIVGRRPPPRRREIVAALASIDVIGLVIAYISTATLTHRWPDLRPWGVLAAFVPLGMHLARCYNVDNGRSAAAITARAIIAATAACLVATLSTPIALLGPVAPWFIGWPAVVRAAMTRALRERTRRVRWLVLGSSECLSQLWHDKTVNVPVGDVVMLSRDTGLHGVPISGRWDSIERWLQRGWAGIVVANNETLPDAVLQPLMRARLRGRRVIMLSDFYERYWSKVPIFHLSDGWFAMSQGFNILNGRGLRAKRIFDVFFAIVLLALGTPIMVFVGLLIRFLSPGPILFRQVRVGENGKHFTIMKFRSMHLDAEAGGPKWATKDDPRAYPFGKFMRKTRLDELPQLINVLRGHMSLIGPRPERPEFTNDLANEIPYFQLRNLVKPGLTGWAQVNYPYGASIEDAREKLQYDFYYIKNHSLWLDLVILVKTVRVVLFGLGGR